MPVLGLNVSDADFLPAGPGGGLQHRLAAAAGDRPETDPIVLLIHGYRYSPFRGPSNPHDSLYVLHREDRERPKRQLSWPAALGFQNTAQDPGLCLPIGWDARGKFAEAFEQAEAVGHKVAALIALLHARYPERPIKVMAHSLGGRVALAALRALPCAMVRQVILLAPADFDTHARAVLETPAGQRAEILQISPPENWLFDTLLEQALRRHPETGAALGRHPPKADNWVSLSLDGDAELQNLAALGHAVAPRRMRVCHWSAYLREGAMDLYSALLTDRGPSALRELLPPRTAS